MEKYKDRYTNKCVPALKEKFGYKNANQVPKLVKIVVNTSIKEGAQDAKILDAAAKDLSAITGQKTLITKARKAIANFKLREGLPIGAKVTLRSEKMYEFMNRLVNVALPRVRDFKGVSKKGFDGSGNYTMGLTEQAMFPEIHYDKIERIFGMNITFVTTAKSNDEGHLLLEQMGVPFSK
jgi:large subunit ribosomal protein L5